MLLGGRIVQAAGLAGDFEFTNMESPKFGRMATMGARALDGEETDPKLPSATAPRQPDQETRGCVVARAWRRRVRHGGLVPAGEMKLGDQ